MTATPDELLTVKTAAKVLRSQGDRRNPTGYDRYCAEIGLALQAVHEVLAREATKERKTGR